MENKDLPIKNKVLFINVQNAKKKMKTILFGLNIIKTSANMILSFYTFFIIKCIYKRKKIKIK